MSVSPRERSYPDLFVVVNMLPIDTTGLPVKYVHNPRDEGYPIENSVLNQYYIPASRYASDPNQYNEIYQTLKAMTKEPITEYQNTDTGEVRVMNYPGQTITTAEGTFQQGAITGIDPVLQYRLLMEYGTPNNSLGAEHVVSKGFALNRPVMYFQITWHHMVGTPTL